MRQSGEDTSPQHFVALAHGNGPVPSTGTSPNGSSNGRRREDLRNRDRPAASFLSGHPKERGDTATLRISVTLLFALSALTFPSLSCADTVAGTHRDSDEPLAEEVNDPTARLTQFELKDDYTPSEYGTNAQPNSFQLRPVFAIRPRLFTPLEQLIRPTIRVVTVPRGHEASTATALHEIQLLDLFVIPFPDVHQTGFRWGVGPYLIFPTSTSEFTGKGAWRIGPVWASHGRWSDLIFQDCSSELPPCVHFIALQIGRVDIDPAHRYLSVGTRMVFKIQRRNLED